MMMMMMMRIRIFNVGISLSAEIVLKFIVLSVDQHWKDLKSNFVVELPRKSNFGSEHNKLWYVYNNLTQPNIYNVRK